MPAAPRLLQCPNGSHGILQVYTGYSVPPLRKGTSPSPLKQAAPQWGNLFLFQLELGQEKIMEGTMSSMEVLIWRSRFLRFFFLTPGCKKFGLFFVSVITDLRCFAFFKPQVKQNLALQMFHNTALRICFQLIIDYALGA